jgi:DNA replication and repair protein RecF
MILSHLSLQNLRSYQKADFVFHKDKTIIIGRNAIGKTNLIEAIYLLTTGKSFRTDKEKQLIQFGEQVARVKGKLQDNSENEELEVVIALSSIQFLQKKYFVNGVSKRRVDFSGKLTAVLFTPLDLEIVSGQPGFRRRFLDEVLEQVDYEYRVALSLYTKGLRQRNALLEHVQTTGIRNDKVFAYWDELLIKNGSIVTRKREEFISFINAQKHDFFPLQLFYDSSIISTERLLQYKDAEVGAGVTLVGPHRDDVIIKAEHEVSKELEEVRYFASRGQQRLVTLELKLAQLAFIKEKKEVLPLLLLDDIFSELDSRNIQKILELTADTQTIITTTHKEFVPESALSNTAVIELSH